MSSTGFVFPGTGANDASIGATAWTTPGNITAADASDATCNAGASSQYLVAKNFGFAIPSGASISGITVTASVSEHSAGTETFNARLQDDAGALTGTGKTASLNGTTKVTYTYGSTSDVWGATLTPAKVNDVDFGVRFWFTTSHDVRVDNVQMAVEYLSGGATLVTSVSTAAAGTATASYSRAPTGQASTTGQGSVTPSAAIAPTGSAVTSGQGTIEGVRQRGQVVTLSQGTLTYSPATSQTLTGSQINSAAGVMLDSGTIPTDEDLVGEVLALAQGASTQTTTIGLKSRKVGGGSAAYAIGGQSLTSAAGLFTPAPSKAPTGQVAALLQGAFAKQRSAALTGTQIASAQTAFSFGTPPSSDWVTRSTGAGVVWAHNFDYDAEVSQHLLTGGAADPTGNGVYPRRVVDGAGYGCLEQIALGARLTANYTAGGTTMQIDDATYWPTSDFYFMACGAVGTASHKNLFHCTSRSGLTLSGVTWYGPVNSAFSSTAQNYVVGDIVGNEAQCEWRRTFSALPAGENGKPVDDPAAAGAVPLRSRLTGNALSVPRDASLWQYGWYGHTSNQTTWANWTPWTSQDTNADGINDLKIPYTARGVSQGAAAKYRLWDGNEFFVQFRMKIDPRFFALNRTDPAGGDSNFVRKAWAFQSENTSLNQLVPSVGTSNIYGIPSTTPMPFYLQTHKAAMTVGSDDWARPSPPAAGHYSHQAGSPWDVAPYYAGLSSSGKPSTGCPTPDGSAAWEWKDNEWVTFYVRVKPGRATFKETEIEVKFARTEDVNYNGTYTTLLSVNDALIPYSGQGDEEFPDGLFDFPVTNVMTALPGYQAFGLMGYFNIFQSADIPPPQASYYIRMAQVIFSKAAIPAPASDVVSLPSYVPAPGTVTTLTVANGGLSNSYISQCAPYFTTFSFAHTNATWGGAFKNPYWGAFGCTLFSSGGHGNHNDNSITILEYGATQMTFKRVMDPTPYFGTGTDGTTKQYNSNATSSDSIGTTTVMGGMDLTPAYNYATEFPTVRPTWIYNYGVSTLGGKTRAGASHTYGGRVFVGPTDGGAANGTLFSIWQPALNQFSQNGCRAAICVDFASTTTPSSSLEWTLHGAPSGAYDGQYGTSPIIAEFVPTQKRIYYVTRATNFPPRWYDMDPASGTYKTYVTGTGTGFSFNDMDAPGSFAESGALMFIPSRNILVCAFAYGGVCRLEWMDVSVSQPTLGGTATLSATFPVSNYWGGITWCPDNNRLIAFGTGVRGDMTQRNIVYEIQIPSTLTSTWTVVSTTAVGTMPDLNTYQAYTSVVGDPWQYHYGKRTEYDKRLKCITYYSNHDAETAPDAVYIYRPRNT